jgi:crotonobetainyl-CoA:carnitine CoA-transferase CaiB-like acyl-CoA transferase
MPEASPAALAGLRVIDMASLYAAPLAASFLADFGADVVKLEPPEGDSFRGTRLWPLVSRGKRSVVADLRTAEGVEALKRLVRGADVVVENYPAAVLQKRGIGWDVLSAINPRLIMLSVSCFGASGPYAERPGSGTIGEAFGGLTHLTGEADGPPVLTSTALGDAVGAMSAAMGVLTALYWRERSGRGQHIDASLYEPILHLVAHAASRWRPGEAPIRNGSQLPGVLRNVFLTADGRHVALSCSTPRHQADLAALAGAPAQASLDEADYAVALWIQQRSQQVVIAELTARRLPVTPVNSLEQLLADPQVCERASLLRLDDPQLGAIVLAAPTPRLSATPGRIGTTDPGLGAHTASVLEAWAPQVAEATA